MITPTSRAFDDYRAPVRLHEDALVALAAQLAMAIRLADAGDDAPVAESEAAQPAGEPVAVRHYPENDSVFLDDDYLIKGVAGSAHARHGIADEGAQGFVDGTVDVEALLRDGLELVHCFTPCWYVARRLKWAGCVDTG